MKTRLVVIALMAILAITIAGVISFLVLTPIYETSTQILVVSSGDTEKEMAVKAKDAILASNSRIIGAVLNNFE